MKPDIVLHNNRHDNCVAMLYRLYSSSTIDQPRGLYHELKRCMLYSVALCITYNPLQTSATSVAKYLNIVMQC